MLLLDKTAEELGQEGMKKMKTHICLTLSLINLLVSKHSGYFQICFTNKH